MAFTITSMTRGVTGNFNAIAGTFTSVKGDNTLIVTHGMNAIGGFEIFLNQVGAQVPKVTHGLDGAGTSTFVWDDTQGASGQFMFLGK